MRGRSIDLNSLNSLAHYQWGIKKRVFPLISFGRDEWTRECVANTKSRSGHRPPPYIKQV